MPEAKKDPKLQISVPFYDTGEPELWEQVLTKFCAETGLPRDSAGKKPVFKTMVRAYLSPPVTEVQTGFTQEQINAQIAEAVELATAPLNQALQEVSTENETLKKHNNELLKKPEAEWFIKLPEAEKLAMVESYDRAKGEPDNLKEDKTERTFSEFLYECFLIAKMCTRSNVNMRSAEEQKRYVENIKRIQKDINNVEVTDDQIKENIEAGIW